MQVKSIAECILQYFQPSLSYILSLILLFCLILSGRLRQVFTVLKGSLEQSEHKFRPVDKKVFTLLR